MTARCVEVLGAPVDLGADRRGVDMGPSAIRYAGLLPGLESCGHRVTDLGNLPMLLADGAGVGFEQARYMNEIVAVASRICDSVGGVVRRGNLPLVLGGDHSMSLGTLGGAGAAGEVGVIWMDAHGDFNTPDTTPSGNVHGMVLAAVAGFGDPAMVKIAGREPLIKPEHIALVGVRELDSQERDLLLSTDVHVFTMSDVDDRGIAAVMTDAIEVASGASRGIHLSLDLDVVDPETAPGVGTPVAGGLTYRECQLAMEMVSASERILSMDVVEVNPILDNHNQTAALAVDFILSALGKRIL
jgi:arginase